MLMKASVVIGVHLKEGVRGIRSSNELDDLKGKVRVIGIPLDELWGGGAICQGVIIVFR